MATNRLLSPPQHFYIAWRRFGVLARGRSTLRYQIKLTQDYTSTSPISLQINGYRVDLSPLSNRFGSWLMLVYGHFTRFVHRSQLSLRGFKRLSRAIQSIRR